MNGAFTSIGKQIRLAESEFRLATVGMQDMEQNVSGLTAQLTMLQDKLALQQAAVQQYEAALAGAKEQLTAAQQVNDPDRIRQARDHRQHHDRLRIEGSLFRRHSHK